MARGRKQRVGKFIAAVIGEGITEWHYFQDLKSVEKLPYQLRPSLPKHSHYKDIFKKAHQLISEGYDEVYCVIDLDIIQNSNKEMTEYEKAKRRLVAGIIVFETMPCTEYWFLLHFRQYSTRIYPDFHSVLGELLGFIPNYEKTDIYFIRNRIYQTLNQEGDLSIAKENANRLCVERTDQDNPLFPFSEFARLLEKLFSHK